MQIDNKTIIQLEDQTSLSFSDDERSCMAEDLQKIIEGISYIANLNTEGVPECIQPFKKENVFRDDEVSPSFDRELILQNAPVKNDEFFIAPKTVE